VLPPDLPGYDRQMIAWIQARAASIITVLLPEPLMARFRHPERAQPLATSYAVATLLALIASEAVALAVVASESSGRLALSIAAAGLAAGACALVAAILLPSGDGG